MDAATQDPREQQDDDAGEPANDSGRRPDHEAVGVGIIHDGRMEEPASGGAAASKGAAMTSADDAADDTLDDDQERRLPTMSRDDPATLESITGVVAQTRQDSGTEPRERIVELLRERLQQAGVELADADLDELADQVSTGDSADADADAG